MLACNATSKNGRACAAPRLWLFLFAALLMLLSAPCKAQTLRHRYRFVGNASDSVGQSNGIIVGQVTLQTDGYSHGSAHFAGGTSASAPGYIRLPVEVVRDLSNATIEIFTTNFEMPKDEYGVPGGQFQALFAVAGNYGDRGTYAILAANRGGAGIGVGLRRNGGPEQIIASPDPLPVWRQNHVLHMTTSGFTHLGSVGTLTIFLDGEVIARAPTELSLAYLCSTPGGVTTVGIGGGSSFNDPTFRGGMSEFRIYEGALTPEQMQANLIAGPDQIGFTPRFALVDAVRALRIAGGLTEGLDATEIARLNPEPGGASPESLDLLDALRIARLAFAEVFTE